MVKIKVFGNWLLICFLLVTVLTGCTSPGQVQKHEVKPVTPEE